jgi:hypothetical protein
VGCSPETCEHQDTRILPILYGLDALAG